MEENLLNQIKKWGTRLLCFLIVASVLLPVGSASTPITSLEKYVTVSSQYIYKSVSEPKIGSLGGEWVVMGLARSGYSIPQTYWDSYYRVVSDYLKSHNGVLHEKKYTEYSRVILALTAVGADPSNVAGYDLLLPLGDYEKTVQQGVNGSIWALLALDSGEYDIPTNGHATVQATRSMYIEHILSYQTDNGGWSISGKSSGADPDLTAMALQALAKYKDMVPVKAAVNKALDYLSAVQNADGGYSSNGVSCSESAAQVLVALCELGIDPYDSRFVKNKNSPLDALLRYRQSDGSFLHQAGDKVSSQMASEQGLYAMVAVLRSVEGKSTLYRMSGDSASHAIGLSGKQDDIKRMLITTPGKSFPDISKHQSRTKIEALASRGIISGRSESAFVPDGTMTRAEFSAIIVKALGFPLKSTSKFSDVPSEAWYAPYIGTAYTYGIVNGISADSFAPNGTITRQEAICMVARAAALCGMETAIDEAEIEEYISNLNDSSSCAIWARESIAFCSKYQISAFENKSFLPKRSILRFEVAEMVFNLLDNAALL